MSSVISPEIRFSVEGDQALDALYAEYGSKTTPQKIKILIDKIGDLQVYAVGGDIDEETKLVCLEHQYLTINGLVELELA